MTTVRIAVVAAMIAGLLGAPAAAQARPAGTTVTQARPAPSLPSRRRPPAICGPFGRMWERSCKMPPLGQH